MAGISLNGIFPPLPTSFNEEGALFQEMIRSNIERLCQYPLTGFLILGSNGELVMLSEKEKVMALEAAREAIPEGTLMLAGTGGQSTRETIWLTREAARTGADAAMVLHPFYYKGLMTPKALVAFYHSVADASEIPVIVYNMPANTGMDLDAPTILQIANHPNIVGLKDSGGNVAKMAQVTGQAGSDFQVLAGSAGFLLPALSVGAVGGILALANIAPRQCLDIMELFIRGDLKAARSLQQRMVAPNGAVTRRWGVPALKYAMDQLGLYGGPTRHPVQPLEKETKEQLTGILKEAGITTGLAS